MGCRNYREEMASRRSKTSPQMLTFQWDLWAAQRSQASGGVSPIFPRRKVLALVQARLWHPPCHALAALWVGVWGRCPGAGDGAWGRGWCLGPAAAPGAAARWQRGPGSACAGLPVEGAAATAEHSPPLCQIIFSLVFLCCQQPLQQVRGGLP